MTTQLSPHAELVLADIRREAEEYRAMLDTHPLFAHYDEEARQREAAEVVLQAATRSALGRIRSDRAEHARLVLQAAEHTADMLHEPTDTTLEANPG